MKTYLLLRNNKQSGPFTLSEILGQGLLPQDLIWVEGRSASWRYPSELDELKAYVPAPVVEAPLSIGFSEVQNRVVGTYFDHSAPSAERVEEHQPMIATEPDDMATFIATPAFHGRSATTMASERAVPAFDALGGVLPEDDLMPTMAWQDVRESIVPGSRVSVLGMPVDALPQPKTGYHPSVGGLPRIKVMLPAATADKTMVVIRRREPSGQQLTELRTRPRRPVLEFIPDEMEPETPATVTNHEISAVIPHQTPLQTEPVLADEPATISIEHPALVTAPGSGDVSVVHAEVDKILEALALVSSEEPVVETEVIEPLDAMDVPLAEELATEAQNAPAIVTTSRFSVSDNLGTVKPELWPKAQVAPTLEANIGLIQKVALVTAVVSLLAVAILFASAFFNPVSNHYGAKPEAKTSVTVSPAAAHTQAKP